MIMKMKIYVLCFALCLFVYLCPKVFVCLAEDSGQSVDGFNLVQYDDGGEKKWELKGKTAEVGDERVNINEVSAVVFGKENVIKLKSRTGSFNRGENIVRLNDNVVIKATDGTAFTTDSLDWNTETRNAYTDSSVSMERSGLELMGKGAEVDLENKTAELKKDVIASIASPETGILQAAPGFSIGQAQDRLRTTEITCNGPLEMSYKKNKAVFLNNVKVKDKEGDIFADRIDVYFNPSTSRIKCVVARGNVKIVNGNNVTYSERAIYLVDQGRVVLPARPKLVINRESQ